MYATIFLALTIAQPLETLPLPPGTELAGLPQPPGSVEPVPPAAKPAAQPTPVEPSYTYKTYTVGRGRFARTYTRKVEVSQPASPFVPEKAATADGDPWLSRVETDRIKAVWPKTLAFPPNLRFYAIPPRYQNLWTMNNGSYKGWASAELHDEPEEFKVSGGMAAIPASDWNSVKGLDVPPGKFIRVRKVPIDVRAFALVPAWQWTFDPGITAYDVLSNASGDIFEIRTRTQTTEGWESKVAFKERQHAPAGYNGAGKACASCHGRTDETLAFSNRIYLTLRWGSGGVFSFRPWNEDGTIDRRWPVEVQ